MYAQMVNVSLAFLEGVALVLSPCILPVLPIVLSGSLQGNKTRPLGIIIGFVASFTVLTLFSRWLIQLFPFGPGILRNVALLFFMLLGLIMISTQLSEKWNRLTQRLANVGNTLPMLNHPQNSFSSGFLFGMLIGTIWTPCAGPILAAVIVLVVIQQTTLSSVFTVIAFAMGAGVPMIGIAFLGRQLIEQFRFFREHALLFRRLLGMLMIASVLLLYYNPVLTFSLSAKRSGLTGHGLVDGLSSPYPAPPIAGIDSWINSSALTEKQLLGNVVLIDFWTYSCINCIRTLPYLKDWYAKYHDKGFMIIGVHSPEFAFEQNKENVMRAVAQDGILYPVALDNQFVTWKNFRNHYWPAHYLIDRNGMVVYEHFGEGDYDVTENNIRYLLGLSGAAPASSQPAPSSVSFLQTPETYLGFARANSMANVDVMVREQTVNYHFPAALPVHEWALQGQWVVHADRIIAKSTGASLKLHFIAQKVYAVMGTVNNASIHIKVLLNDQVLPKSEANKEVQAHQLYSLLALKKESEGVLEIIADSPGLEIYTFTFG